MSEEMPPLARALETYMSDISEAYYCAGWLIGLEYTLWGMVIGGDRTFGLGEVSGEEVETLKALSEACGGWIDERGFVPLAEWERRYALHAAGRLER